MARQLDLARFLRQTDIRRLLVRSAKAGTNQWTIVGTALDRVDAYLQAAATQQRRIARAAASLNKLAEPRSNPSSTGSLSRRRMSSRISSMGIEIHFYLICWNAIRQQLELVRSVTQSPGLRTLLRVNHVRLDEYRRMRDDLEHYDERLRLRGRRAARNSVSPMRNPVDFGNFSRDWFSFGGNRVDISAKSLLALRDIVEKSLAVLKQEAWDALLQQQPALAQRLVLTYARDKQLQAMLRRLANGGRP